MAPIDAVTVSLDSSVRIAAIYSEQGCPELYFSIRASASKDRPENNAEDRVITPGGPRPRHKVHHVKPGGAVRQNEDGTYTIVPNNTPGSLKPDKNQNQK
jgi:hypothetical protein